jgi:hypothetical protein
VIRASNIKVQVSVITLAAMFTVSASSVALKMNETMPCAVTVWRIGFDVTATSETCDVMPMTNEK